MGMDDMLNKAKDLLGEHSEQVDGAIDKAADLVQEKTPDNIDSMVESAADKAKDIL